MPMICITLLLARGWIYSSQEPQVAPTVEPERTSAPAGRRRGKARSSQSSLVVIANL